jgi:hypothetical protein
MFGLCSRSTPEFGLGYTFWRPACGRQAWREEKKLAKTQRRKGRKKSLGDLAPLREQKKKISAADEAGIKIS